MSREVEKLKSCLSIEREGSQKASLEVLSLLSKLDIANDMFNEILKFFSSTISFINNGKLKESKIEGYLKKSFDFLTESIARYRSKVIKSTEDISRYLQDKDKRAANKRFHDYLDYLDVLLRQSKTIEARYSQVKEAHRKVDSPGKKDTFNLIQWGSMENIHKNVSELNMTQISTSTLKRRNSGHSNSKQDFLEEVNFLIEKSSVTNSPQGDYISKKESSMKENQKMQPNSPTRLTIPYPQAARTLDRRRTTLLNPKSKRKVADKGQVSRNYMKRSSLLWSNKPSGQQPIHRSSLLKIATKTLTNRKGSKTERGKEKNLLLREINAGGLIDDDSPHNPLYFTIR